MSFQIWVFALDAIFGIALKSCTVTNFNAVEMRLSAEVVADPFSMETVKTVPAVSLLLLEMLL